MEKPSKVDWKKSYWAEAEKCAGLTVDHLRLYVLPEIKRRGLAQAFMDKCIRPENCLELGDEEDTYGWWLLNASPSVLARAALDILRKATKW